MPFFVLGRRWPPAPAGKFSPHAGAATHGNGISKLATHPPQHADAPPLQPGGQWSSPPFPLTGARQRENFHRHAECFNPRKWHFRTRHPPATPRGCALPLQLAVKPGVSQLVGHCRFCYTQLYRRTTRRFNVRRVRLREISRMALFRALLK